jgi:hypothetical protein
MKRPILVVSISLLACAVSLAQPGSIPIQNWTVPPYAPSSEGITTMTDATPPRVFVGVQPCRIVDTRSGSGFPAGFGGPSLAPGVPRNFDLDSGPCPGLPLGIDSYSLNVTVTNTGGPGHLVIYPQGGAQPTVSSINYVGGQTIANAVIVPAGAGAGVTVVAGVSGTDLLIDINGYFSDLLGTPENFLAISTNSSQYSILATNSSLTCIGPCGIRSNVSTHAGGHAISGYAVGSEGTNYGVYGETSSGSINAAGVRGLASASPTVPTFGVFGETHSSATNSAGVYGFVNHATASAGYFVNALAASAYIALQETGVNYGLFTFERIRAGSLDITGAPKNFVSPHPENPALEIRYASVEAPTVDVYFRGTATLVNGYARVEVPDHFRFTAREGTYMTTLAPLDSAIPLRVAQEGPEGIVVRGAGNTRFHYVVYAERAEIVGYEPVTKNTSFTPGLLERGGGPGKLPESTRALLVKNGTLNADGSYNLETARAQGWTIPEPASRPDLQSP